MREIGGWWGVRKSLVFCLLVVVGGEAMITNMSREVVTRYLLQLRRMSCWSSGDRLYILYEVG